MLGLDHIGFSPSAGSPGLETGLAALLDHRRAFCQPGVESLADLVGRERGTLALVPGDDDAGGRHASDSGQSQPLPQAHAMIVP